MSVCATESPRYAVLEILTYKTIGSGFCAPGVLRFMSLDG